jgi:nucleolar protein 53
LDGTERCLQAPRLAHPRDDIRVPSIAQPHQGTSYNPLAAAHEELLSSALKAEVERTEAAEKQKEWAEKVEKAQSAARAEEVSGVPAGMSVGNGEEGSDEEEWGGVLVPVKRPERKTRQQRAKAAKLLEEVQVQLWSSAK